MYDYYVIVRGNSNSTEFYVNGCEAAWEVYRKACNLCELTDGMCDLVDYRTGEVIESFNYEIDYEPADIDNDMGFDPYEGCYTYDC